MWVLDAVYKYKREEILSAIEKMLALPVLSLESPDLLEAFLAAAQGSRTDLPDLLIGAAAKANDCEITLSFDKRAAKKGSLFRILS